MKFSITVAMAGFATVAHGVALDAALDQVDSGIEFLQLAQVDLSLPVDISNFDEYLAELKQRKKDNEEEAKRCKSLL